MVIQCRLLCQTMHLLRQKYVHPEQNRDDRYFILNKKERDKKMLIIIQLVTMHYILNVPKLTKQSNNLQQLSLNTHIQEVNKKKNTTQD